MRQFYNKLYSTEYNTLDELRKSFLDQISLPSLTEEQRELLNRPVTREEVLDAIRTLQSGKAPGPDGYGPEYYKKNEQSCGGPSDQHVFGLFQESMSPSLSKFSQYLFNPEEK